MLWSIEYYAQFCDVDTKQVLDRCWAAIFPRVPFLDVLGGNPDLYGCPPSQYPSMRLIGRSVLDYFDHNSDFVFFVYFGGISRCLPLWHKI